MSARVLRLYPAPQKLLAAKGLYLGKLPTPAEPPFVYGNFLSSLDGRIAIGDDHASRVPPDMTSDTDLRLLLELQAQADCLLTHGAYLRALAAGTLGDVLTVGGQSGTDDLLAWRRAQRMQDQPAVVIASRTLDFVLPANWRDGRRQVIVATIAGARAARIDELEAQGCCVIRAGEGPWVEALPLLAALRPHGFRRIYLLAGPRILHTMLQAQRLDRLYLTQAHRLVGGETFHTMVRGPVLGDAGSLRMTELYLHNGGTASGQVFGVYEPCSARGPGTRVDEGDRLSRI